MLMPVTLLADRLGDKVVWRNIPDKTPDLGALEFALHPTNFVAGRAYFGNEKPLDMPSGCVWVTTAESDYQPDIAVIWCCGDISDIYHSAMDAFQEFQDFSARFANALQSGNDIQSLIELAAEYLQNQLLIVDRMMQIVARSHLEPQQPDPIWEEICLNARLPEHVMNRMAPLYPAQKTNRSDIQSRLDKGIELYGIPNVHVDLLSNGTFLGWLILIANRSKLREGMMVLLSRLSLPITFLMEIRHEEQKPDLAFDEYSWRELLAGRLRDPWLINSLLIKAGWLANDDFRVFQIERVDEHLPVNMPLTADIRNLPAQAIILPGEHNLILIEKLPAGNDHKFFLDKLSVWLNRYFFVAGASDVNKGVDRLPILHAQAIIAIEEGNEASAEPIRHFHKASVRYLLELPEVKAIQAVFMHPAVVRLNASGSSSRKSMRTLLVYLECECQLAPAAKILDIHKNTLLYRIGRLRETYKLNLDDTEERLRLLLSLKMLPRQEFW